MKKKVYMCMILLTICIVGILIYFNQEPAGDTLESRQQLLSESIENRGTWFIVKEVKIEDYIICAAYSTGYRSAIAVFEPDKNGKYKFARAKDVNSDYVITYGAYINDQWYDLIWFNGAQTEYAEVRYNVNGENKVLTFDTSNMDIICNKAPSEDYSYKAIYYDFEGNTYE